MQKDKHTDKCNCEASDNYEPKHNCKRKRHSYTYKRVYNNCKYSYTYKSNDNCKYKYN